MDKKAELDKTKVEMNVAKEKNLKKAKLLRHDVAQVSTIIKEKSLMENVEVSEEKEEERKEKKS